HAVVASAAPIPAPEDNGNNWGSSAATVCSQEVAVVPVLGTFSGNVVISGGN
ncbi:hypothetical protein BGZ93_002057, partial [Podila epicladia]